MNEYKGRFDRVLKITELARNADGIVLVTEWPEFKDLPFNKLARLMNNALLVDSKNYLDPAALTAAGFDYQGFGRKCHSTETIK